MRRREYSVVLGATLGALIALTGCSGLEKGPAPALPYTPEPPAPKTEKKADVPKGLRPSTPVPIKVGPPTKAPAEKKDAPAEKKDGAAVKDQPPAPDAKKDVPPAAAPKADEKKATEPVNTEAKKDVTEPKK